MDEARAINKIEVSLLEEKIDFINDAHQKELQYRKNIALASKNEYERKQLTDLAPLRGFLACKAVVKSDVKNFNKIIFYLKNQYLRHNQERGSFIEDILNQEERSLEESDHLKTFPKSIKENENMSLKNKPVIGDWI